MGRAGAGVAEPLRAEPESVVLTAHASRPGEAAVAPVEPQANALELGPELEYATALMPGIGPARRRAATRAGAARSGARRPAGPGAPSSWPQPERAVIRVEAPALVADAGVPPVRRVDLRARGPPGAPAGDESSMHPAGSPRAAALLYAHCAAAGVQAKLAVGQAGDPFEREADAVATRVVHGAAPARPPAAGALHAAVSRTPAQARGPPGADLPGSVTTALRTGGGQPLDPALRARIEPHVGADLGHVRVRHDPAAAADLRARAFTSGATIYLAAGSSAHDVALMAHEATHVVQQSASAAAASTLQRLEVDDLIPDWILDGVRDAVRAIPGYSILTTITGEDLLTGAPASTSPQELVEKLLTYGPFGAAVGPLLSAIDVLGDVVGVITDGLAANDLTLARIGRDIETAWNEFSITNGISGNLAIVERLVSALLRDVSNFVSSIVDRVIELVRDVVADVAEPLLETPAIKPIWDLAKKVLHYDPLRGEAVAAPTAEIIADFLVVIHEDERLAQMQERGTLQETADWLDTQFATFESLIGELGALFSAAWAAIQPANLPNLLTDLEALAQQAFGFVQRVVEFGTTLIAQVLELVKDSLLGFLSEHAHSVPGYHLLTVILEQDPFTGETVQRTARNLIRGFITLMPGGEATYDQLAESGVIDQAAERIESEMVRLGISVELITGIFVGIWDTLTLDDLLDPIGAFTRIIALFGEPLARLVEFVIVVIEVVVTLVLRLMNFPSELLGSIISNTVAAIDRIAADPIAFLLNMLEALKLGFSSFLDHIGTHLLSGLTAWLFRGLGQLGIELPRDFSLGSILNLVFQVLGLTIEHLWEKLGEHIGAERVAMIRGAIDTLTGIWTFIQDVQRDGLAAIWSFISSQLGGLWDTLLSMATEWIMSTVVTAVTTRLLSLLDPTGIMAVVNSFIAFFNAVQSAIEYLRDILEIVNQYVTTLAQVAAGNVAPGAQMLEQGLANAIPIAIGFLAAQVGLGNIPEKIVEIIGRLRELVDEALDWLIEQALRLGQAVLNALGLGPEAEQPAQPGAAPGEVVFEVDGARHRLFRQGADPAHATPMINPDPVRPVAAELDALAARVETDLPIAEDRTAARAAVAAARGILSAPAATGVSLTELEPHLRILYSKLGHPDVPETHVEGHLSPMGAQVTASPLTRKAGNTQGSSSTSGAHVDQRNDIARLNAGAGLSARGHASIEWVAAHLLSARLHGPNAAGNFTPVSQRDNGVLLRGVEQPAINLLAADEGRNVLWWNATVTPSSDPALPHWADTVSIRFGRWDAASGDGHGAQLGQADARPRPDFSGARSIGSLSEDGAVRLAGVTGMNPSVARTIVAVREARLPGGGRFSSWDHVVELVMFTARTGASGTLTPTSAETTLAELDRIRDRLVPYFGFDADADIRRYLDFLATR